MFLASTSFISSKISPLFNTKILSLSVYSLVKPFSLISSSSTLSQGSLSSLSIDEHIVLNFCVSQPAHSIIASNKTLWETLN